VPLTLNDSLSYSMRMKFSVHTGAIANPLRAMGEFEETHVFVQIQLIPAWISWMRIEIRVSRQLLKHAQFLKSFGELPVSR
jgi:hypothetical protein